MLILGQLLERKGIKFDARKFEWIGSPMKLSAVIAFSKRSGITSIEKWRTAKQPPSIGVTAPGSNLYDVPKIVSATLNLPTKFVPGYGGFSEARLALEGGEVDGVSPSWQGVKSTWRKKYQSGEVSIVVQSGSKPHPDLPDVPLAIKLAKTRGAKEIIRVGINEIVAVKTTVIKTKLTK